MKIFQRLVVGAVFIVVFASFVGLAHVIATRQNPELKLEKMLINKENRVVSAYFSPDDQLASLLKGLIDAERKKIIIAIYTLTDKTIVEALKRAAQRGVVIEVVADPSYGSDRYSQIFSLANAGISIWSYRSAEEERQASLMHNKFCVFEQSIGERSLLWTGSYNFTKRANERNQENVVILDDPSLINRYRKQFDILKERSIQISGKTQNYNRPVTSSELSFFDKLKTFFKMF